MLAGNAFRPFAEADRFLQVSIGHWQTGQGGAVHLVAKPPRVPRDATARAVPGTAKAERPLYDVRRGKTLTSAAPHPWSRKRARAAHVDIPVERLE